MFNASSARYIRLSIGGAPFRILGTDGGLIEAPVTASEVLLVPADRVDLAVGPFREGDQLAIESLAYYRATVRRRKKERFATLRVGPAKPSTAVLPERLRNIPPLVTGPVTLNMRGALERTWQATPDPKWVVAVGDCARDGGCFAGSYAVAGGVADVIPVDLLIPGCPPPPARILSGLLALLDGATRSPTAVDAAR